MHPGVLPWRHVAIVDRVRQVVVLRWPLAEVQGGAATIDVALHEPRHRRHVAVPRPAGLVAVAVEAGAHHKRPGLLRRPRRLLHHGRVVVITAVGHQLDQESEHGEREEDAQRPADAHGGVMPTQPRAEPPRALAEPVAPSMITCVPWHGISVTARRFGRSSCGDPALGRTASSTSRSTSRCSSMARPAPRQRRTPPPSGSHVARLVARHRGTARGRTCRGRVVALRVGVHEVHAHQHVRARRDLVPAGGAAPMARPGCGPSRRSPAATHALVHDRIEIGLVAGLQAHAQAVEYARMVHQEVEGPRQRGGVVSWPASTRRHEVVEQLRRRTRLHERGGPRACRAGSRVCGRAPLGHEARIAGEGGALTNRAHGPRPPTSRRNGGRSTSSESLDSARKAASVPGALRRAIRHRRPLAGSRSP